MHTITESKTALLIGATGATGRALLERLLVHPAYDKVVAFSRRPIHLEHPRLTVQLVDFEKMGDWADLLRGDELFSTLGTTLKLAGSKQAQYRVDFYQLAVAEAARDNGVQRLFLVSSPGADPQSRSFYLRMKGELDHAVQELCFRQCVLIKPSLIEAERPDTRAGEKIAGFALRKLASALPPLRRMQPITAGELASAIINIAQLPLPEGIANYSLNELFAHTEPDLLAEVDVGAVTAAHAQADARRDAVRSLRR